jgi:type II secretory pathway component GspD/PulD (secretin)
MDKALHQWPITLLCLFMSLAVYAADLTVIDLHHRTAEELLPVLQPLAGSDTSLSGLDYKLLVRGSPAAVARIREALSVLDRAPRQLLVSVRFGGQPSSERSQVGVTGQRQGSGTQVRVSGSTVTSTSADAGVSSVRVLEGNAAHIATGESVPIVTAAYVGGRGGIGMGTEFRELTSGFTVVPRVNGQQVMLDIRTRQQRAIDSNGAATVQRADTTVGGALGQWIELGGVSSSESHSSRIVGTGGAAQRVSTQSDERSIAVKVDLIQ